MKYYPKPIYLKSSQASWGKGILDGDNWIKIIDKNGAKKIFDTI